MICWQRSWKLIQQTQTLKIDHMDEDRLKQYASDLHQEVLAKISSDDTELGNANVLLREEAFTEHILDLLGDHNEADSVELTYYEAAGTRGLPAAKLNAWSLSGDGATADLFVVLYGGDGTQYEVGLPKTRDYFQRARGFLRRALDGYHVKMEESSDGFRVMQQIYEAKESLTTVRLFFITDGNVRSLDIQEEQLPRIEVRYVVWDLDKLSRLRVGHREIIELDFVNNYKGAIPCLQTVDFTGEYQTFLAFLPAPILAQIYGEHGQRLLEKNVRAFLQSKGKINRGLQRTLKDEPYRFLAYNNGLCCTAAEIRARDGAIEWVKDFQIVNGGQTTASIYHALKKEKVDITHVNVQVKLTVLKDPTKVLEIVPLISLYANSQNKVNTADFSANDIFHQKLESLSRTIWAPAADGMSRPTRWYYERARGSHLDDKSRAGTPAKQKAWLAEHPMAQKFTKTDVAKYEHVWDQLPHEASKGAEKNFVEWTLRRTRHGMTEPDEKFFRELVAKAILWRKTEKVVAGLKQGGYRANVVAYTIARLSRETGGRLDLESIWKKQAIPTDVQVAIEVISKEAFAYLIATAAGRNVTEWAKKEECWIGFRSREISIPDLSAVTAKTRAENGSLLEAVTAKAGRRNSWADLFAEIERLRPGVWDELATWGEHGGNLQEWQRTMCRNFRAKLERGKKPSMPECKTMLDMFDAASAKGFMP
jgi:hypothetical protein